MANFQFEREFKFTLKGNDQGHIPHPPPAYISGQPYPEEEREKARGH